MPGLRDFLDRLFHQGEIVFSQPPGQAEDQAPAAAFLKQAFAEIQLEIAGPRLDYQPRSALAAAEFLRQACWFLVHRGEPMEDVQRRLRLAPPGTPPDHLSADLVLRYLPQVHRRARAISPDDALAIRSAEVLRQWPLSGVLSDVPEAPLTPLDFGGHPGLLLLYAERFAENEKPEWQPDGLGRDYLKMVRQESRAAATRKGRR